MARSKSRSKPSRYYYAIPIIAIVIVASFFVIAYVLPPPSDLAESFDVALQIQVATNSTASRLVAAPIVGQSVAGATWAVHTYDFYGAGGNYPLFTDAPVSGQPYTVIHVRSRVVWNYTVGDFFDVWGQPLGATLTLNQSADGVHNFWQMCVGVVGNPPAQLGTWRSELLTPNKLVVIMFYLEGGSGCL